MTGRASSVGPIVVEGVGKRFRRGTRHDSFRDWLAARIGRRPATPDRASPEFWALRDVSFTVAPGDVLGVIGANGAGKSTLLKVLTRVMPPTTGRVVTRGRLASLLELSAGFHPDLTGRENVFLQAAILGMPQRDAARRFDEIVAFAGVEAFLDTPVKRYSSGMHARLGFAIAAHLEPDALVIDEVLSVGDFAFQARAHDRMRALAQRGIPVVVVSHQLERLAELCTAGLVLQGGRVGFRGTLRDCAAWYVAQAGASPVPEDPDAPVHLTRLELAGPAEVASGQDVRLRVHGVVRDPARMADIEAVGVRVRSLASGEIVSITSSARCGVALDHAGPFALDVTLQVNVPAGPYTIEVQPWDRRHERALQASLAAPIGVTEGTSFLGRVQLNPRMVRSTA